MLVGDILVLVVLLGMVVRIGAAVAVVLAAIDIVDTVAAGSQGMVERYSIDVVVLVENKRHMIRIVVVVAAAAADIVDIVGTAVADTVAVVVAVVVVVVVVVNTALVVARLVQFDTASDAHSHKIADLRKRWRSLRKRID